MPLERSLYKQSMDQADDLDLLIMRAIADGRVDAAERAAVDAALTTSHGLLARCFHAVRTSLALMRLLLRLCRQSLTLAVALGGLWHLVAADGLVTADEQYRLTVSLREYRSHLYAVNGTLKGLVTRLRTDHWPRDMAYENADAARLSRRVVGD